MRFFKTWCLFKFGACIYIFQVASYLYNYTCTHRLVALDHCKMIVRIERSRIMKCNIFHDYGKPYYVDTCGLTLVPVIKLVAFIHLKREKAQPHAQLAQDSHAGLAASWHLT